MEYFDEFLTGEEVEGINFNSKNLEDILKVDFYDGIEHGIRVSNLSFLLSKELGMEEWFCYEMSKAGMIHDIGKIRLSSYLYGRHKSILIIEEMKYIRMHPKFSYDIIKDRGYSDTVTKAVIHHHENYDGTGYPSNLAGNNIPIGARILRICDVFIALTSNRQYRSAFDMETAVDLMIDEVKNFDMEIFLHFQRLVCSEEFKDIMN